MHKSLMSSMHCQVLFFFFKYLHCLLGVEIFKSFFNTLTIFVLKLSLCVSLGL